MHEAIKHTSKKRTIQVSPKSPHRKIFGLNYFALSSKSDCLFVVSSFHQTDFFSRRTERTSNGAGGSRKHIAGLFQQASIVRSRRFESTIVLALPCDDAFGFGAAEISLFRQWELAPVGASIGAAGLLSERKFSLK